MTTDQFVTVSVVDGLVWFAAGFLFGRDRTNRHVYRHAKKRRLS